jgi:hypothetical protein
VIEMHVARFLDQMAGRIGGPMTFRFVVQPAVAAFLGIRAGLKDAAAPQRPAGFAGSMKDVGRLWTFAFALDAIYQVFVLRAFYPLQSLLVSVLLALGPYLLARMTAGILAGRRRRR